MGKEKVRFRIFLTKTKKLRVSITEVNGLRTEVTIGSKSWNEGKCKEHHKTILNLCDNLFLDLLVDIRTIQKKRTNEIN